MYVYRVPFQSQMHYNPNPKKNSYCLVAANFMAGSQTLRPADWKAHVGDGRAQLDGLLRLLPHGPAVVGVERFINARMTIGDGKSPNTKHGGDITDHFVVVAALRVPPGVDPRTERNRHRLRDVTLDFLDPGTRTASYRGTMRWDPDGFFGKCPYTEYYYRMTFVRGGAGRRPRLLEPPPAVPAPFAKPPVMASHPPRRSFFRLLASLFGDPASDEPLLRDDKVADAKTQNSVWDSPFMSS